MSSINPAITVGRQIAAPSNLFGRTSREGTLGQAVELIGAVRIPDAHCREGARAGHQSRGNGAQDSWKRSTSVYRVVESYLAPSPH
jgi:oligopeptide transport system ATP-binding protein